MSYIAQQQGKAVQVQVQEQPDGLYRVRLEDREYLVDYLEPQPNLLSLLIDGRSYEVDVNRGAGDRFDVVIAGDAYTIEVAEEKKRRSRPLTGTMPGRQQVTSPMSGNVMAILVQLGDRVTVGQPLLILEAMKMQNEIVSPMEGVVSAMKAQEGVPVHDQELLCILEPDT